MKRPLIRLLLALAVGTAAAVPQAAVAQEVTGWRSARFGMSEAQVRQAILREFQVPPSAIVTLDNPAERTRVLSAVLPALEPGPGPATVSFILGASSRRLVHVNIAWQAGASAAERDRLSAAGILLARNFRERPWQPQAAVAGVREAPGVLVLFAGVDAKGSGVELRLSGVPIVGTDGTADLAAPPSTAELRISYAANVARPDIVRLPPGAF